jgi:hypothetical protein
MRMVRRINLVFHFQIKLPISLPVNILLCFFWKIIKNFMLEGNMTRTYFLSSRLLSTCEQWYWTTYTDILFKRSVNLTYD